MMFVELVLGIVALWCVCVVLFYTHKTIRWFTGTRVAVWTGKKQNRFCSTCGMGLLKEEIGKCDYCSQDEPKKEKFPGWGISQDEYWKGNIYSPMASMRPKIKTRRGTL